MSQLKPPPVSLLDKYYGEDAQTIYTGRVRVTGGEAAHGRASGVVCSDDGALQVSLRLPVELDGPGGGTNPEQLLAAGYGACFHGVLKLLAIRAGVELTDATVDTAVTFARDPVDGLFLLSAEIRVALPGVERALAAELVRNAERICPYAKMFRDGIDHVVALACENESSRAGDAD
ncbi:Ohr family peroxiredoxin [Lysobacter arenosi]|jgi:osmotically inducible protein OsmC|uniref:Ohr family peroxiredoxin n=1 Tax=Lysobacter arenosi TaxID=2795387 RepID=A0ABX7R9E2_9GAMM|nr:Ohr family peroxiredoxin [Lysobacter arenosi]QSX74694.1 Ohr family peroxiredoxin [Lysobacter arenosi]